MSDLLKELDPERVARDYGERTGGIRSCGDYTRAGMLAALKWATSHDGGNCDFDKITAAEAALEGEDG